MADVGLITGANTKQASPLATKLGRAFEFNRQEEIRQTWQEVVQNNKFLADLVTTVRIKGGMTPNDLRNHIQFAAGETKNKEAATGASTIIDILRTSELITEIDGKLRVATPQTVSETEIMEAINEEKVSQPITQPANGVQLPPAVSNLPTIKINIELHLPETHDAEVYDKLFQSLKKHLLTRDPNE